MNPFKYIAEIIAQFSKSQRIIALLLLLLTITIIFIVPKLINAFTHDDTSLNNRIETQKKLIGILNRDSDSLNNVIRKNQLECTNQIIARESEILNKISHVTDLAKKSSPENKPERVMAMSSEGDVEFEIESSSKKSKKSSSKFKIEEPKSDPVLNGLMSIKKDIQKSINDKKSN